MSVEYFDGGKRARFAGKVYTRDDRTGYYLNATIHERLHRAVYEAAHGPIPKGMQVHHIDFDKGNNEPENLILLTPSEHMRIHSKSMPQETRSQIRAKMLVEERRQKFKINIKKAQAAAAEWHKSAEGRAWHLLHYEQFKDKLHKTAVFRCENCGKEFVAEVAKTNRFCSNACKSAARRKSGVDDETRICAMCGKQFRVNKYDKAKCCSKSCGCRYRWKNQE